IHHQRRKHRRRAVRQRQPSLPKTAPPVVDLPAGHPILACNRRQMRLRQQALRGDPSFLCLRTTTTPCWPLDDLEPTDAASIRDVQLDVHFAVCSHASLQNHWRLTCTFASVRARGDRRSAYTYPLSDAGSSLAAADLRLAELRSVSEIP